MGCGTSKLDDLPAVALCRDRCKFLDEALGYSRTLADAQLAYLESLRTLGPALHRFFDRIDVCSSDAPANADPPLSKMQPTKSSSAATSSPDHSSSTSNSGSHLHFRSDSEDEYIDRDLRPFTQIDQNYLYRYEANAQSFHDFGISGYGSASKPSPPSPPSNSTWDFLNFFDADERYEPLFAPSWDRGAAEKASGAVDKDQNAVATPENGNIDEKKADKAEKNDNVKKDQSEKSNKPVASRSSSRKVLVVEVMKEVRVLFDKASDSGDEVSRLLSYRQRSGTNQVFDYIGFDESASSRSFSSTFNRLCIWEKKLYAEVKAEERLRIMLERKFRQLKNLDQKIVDARRVDSIRTLIGNVSTKLKVSIQIVDRISSMISKLRDEELWAHMTELINGLLGMWRDMLDCHKCQHQAIAKAESFDVISFYEKLDDDHLEAALQLKLELQNWNLRFSRWTIVQRDFVKALNGWLLRCLLSEPEEMSGSTFSFSPARVGAPPVFVSCYRWSQAVDQLSGKEVTEAIRGFVAGLDLVLEKHSVDVQGRLSADKDLERKIKNLEREEQKIQKVMQAWQERAVPGEKRGFFVPVESLCRSEAANSANLRALKHIFKALEGFSASSMKAYEDLYKCTEENRRATGDIAGL